MVQQRDDLAKEVKRIEDENDGFALATEDEEDLIQTLKQVKTRLAKLGNSEDLSEENAKYQILHGVLYFRLQSEFIPRLWSVKNNLRELDRALEKTRETKRSLVKAANEAPKFFEGYDQKIDWSKKRISNLLSRLGSAISQQEAYIQKLALDGLTKRRQALENYHVRARFGIARLYDTLIIEKDKKKQVGGAESPDGAAPAASGTAPTSPATTEAAPAAAPAAFAAPKSEVETPAATTGMTQTSPVPATKSPESSLLPSANEPLPVTPVDITPTPTVTPEKTVRPETTAPAQPTATEPSTISAEPEPAPAAVSTPEPEPETPPAPSGTPSEMPMPVTEPGADIPEALLNAQ